MDANANIKPVGLNPVQPSTSLSGGGFSDSRSSQEAERALRYRLVIEEGGAPGRYVYKTLDRVTGEVVRQLPREDLVTMQSQVGYAAGAVISTKV